ncbi:MULTISPECIES: GNAT family N-acetyltransferase [Paenibacillus]|uniref:GNAT family N-acetyltransferase n=1 Tax=Paenibacillus TaxID=44249 RepID=UPI0022B8A38C|nr:GNAT family N-acetyltransferase [Paenibacillus caseinilyticus]MCZ8523179.1 GNAT family N-acetyltransferase [Paenibacillus caseinilyticus]
MDLRLVQSHELAEAARLADSIFRDGEQSSMGDAFPDLFTPGIGHSYGAFTQEGQLVAFMGMAPGVVRIGPARLRVFSMGAVCTHEAARGQGIGSRLLALCKAHAEAAGASLLFISGDRSLYTRAHCYPFGHTERFTLDAAAAERLQARSAAEPLLPGELQPADLPAMHELAAARCVAYEQSVTDLPRLLAAEAYAGCFKLTHRTLTARRQDGSLAAYAIFAVPGTAAGRKNPFAVEWGGSPEGVALLLAAAVGRFGLQALDVTAAWHEEALLRLLGDTGLRPVSGTNGGTLYLVNAQRLLQQAAPYWGETPLPSVSLMEDGQYRLTGDGGAETVLTQGELVRELFDPGSLEPEARSALLLPALPLPNVNGLNYI